MPISILPVYPAASIASTTRSSASLLSCTFGANPPSSPTEVLSIPYFPLMMAFKLWYVSDAICNTTQSNGHIVAIGNT